MKKFFLFTFFFLLFNTFTFAKSNLISKKYSVNDIITGKFHINKNFVIELPKGEWILAEKSADYYYGLSSKTFTLVRLERNRVVESIEIAEMKTAGIYEDIVNQAIYEAMFKNKYDGCYQRPEYTIVEFYVKGSTHNCFWVKHSDVYKNLYTPDDPEVRTANSQIIKWIKKNNVEIPKVALVSNHAYFSRLATGKWYLMSYGIDPILLGASENNFISEESSEYNKNNIMNYPEHKKIMEKWISISAQRHIEFEDSIGAKEKHSLDLENYYPEETSYDENSTNNFLNQLQELNELYKSGVLTKEEFEKAKKKILN